MRPGLELLHWVPELEIMAEMIVEVEIVFQEQKKIGGNVARLS